MKLSSTSVDSAGMKCREAISAAVIGNVLEWYDFAVYGYLATVIAKNFFLTRDELSSLLAAFGVFGVGFLVRPLGGVIIGRMGDVKGRKSALLFTLFFMAVGTAGIGLLPSARSIGSWATVLLVLLRLVQGFSVGGEWAGSTAFIVEWAPQERRGFFGSFQQVATGGGLLLGSGIAAFLSTVLVPGQMENWGWRIPFLLGGLIAPVGFYMRRNIGETPAFLEASVAEEILSKSSMALLAAKAFGFTIFWTVSYYLILTYLPTFTQRFAGLSATQALWSNTIGLVVLVAVIPFAGLLSDHIGRKPVLLTSCLSFVFLSYPLFRLLIASVHLASVIVIQVIFCLMIALFSGPGPAALSEIFPTRSRSMLMSTGYALAVAIFGGFAPYVAIWLTRTTGRPLAPTAYLIGAAMVSTVVILFLDETAHEKLR